MAEIESSIRTFLCGKSGVTNIFGATAVCRVYVDRVDPKITRIYPYAIIRTVTEAPMYAHDGALPDTGVYQIDVYSDSKTTVNTGTTAIRAELTGFSGTMDQVTVGRSFIVNTRGDFDPDTRTFRRSTDVEISQSG